MAFGGFGACMGLVVWLGVVCVSRWLPRVWYVCCVFVFCISLILVVVWGCLWIGVSCGFVMT